MKTIYFLIGEGPGLTIWQMCIRAAVIFFVTLILIRFGGVRIFGKRSGFDTIIMITLGAVLARGIVGASPFLDTIAAGATLVVIHRILGWLCFKNRFAERLIKGDRSVLYAGGKIVRRNLERASLSETDLYESLRLETKQDKLDSIETAFIETNGRISFILKKKD